MAEYIESRNLPLDKLTVRGDRLYITLEIDSYQRNRKERKEEFIKRVATPGFSIPLEDFRKALAQPNTVGFIINNLGN